MSETDSNSSSIMSVAEIIDSAFGLPHENTVNHKLIQSVLFILASQLKLLERQVEVVGSSITSSSSTLSITEVRLKARKKDLESKISGVGVAGIEGTHATAPQGGKLRRSARKKATPETVIEEEKENREIKGQIEEEDEKEKARKLKKHKKVKRFEDGSSYSSETSSSKLYLSAAEIRSDKEASLQPDKDDKATTDKSTPDQRKFEKSLPDKTAVDKSSLEKKTKPTFSPEDDKTLLKDDRTSFRTTSTEKTASKQTPLIDKKSVLPTSLTDNVSMQRALSSGKASVQRTSSTDIGSMQQTLSTGKASVHQTSSTDKGSMQRTSSTDKGSMQRTPSTDKGSMQRTSSTDKASIHQKLATDKTSLHLTSSAEKTSVKQSSVEKALGQPISSSREPSAGKTQLDSSASQQIPSADKTFSAEKTSREPTTLSYQTRAEKMPSDISIGQRTPSTDKTTFQRTATEKTSVKTPDYTFKETTSLDKTIMAPASPPEEPVQTSLTKKPTKQTKSSETSYNKTTTETKKDRISSLERSDSDKTAAGKGAKSTSTKKHIGTSKGKKDRLNRRLLEDLEEKRERLLRIIHQRADSWEEYDKSPTPMASLDSFEAEYEKLLVVERVSSKEAREREKAARKGQTKIPKLSIVTQEEFDALAQTVRRIQEKYKEVGRLQLPENLELMHELRKGASLTDAMGALQLSARLEAAEKTLQNMMNLVTELASKSPEAEIRLTDDMEVLYGAKPKSPALPKESTPTGTTTATSKKSVKMGVDVTSSDIAMEIELKKAVDKDSGATEAKEPITNLDLHHAIQNLHDTIMETVEENKNKTTRCAENIQRHVKLIEGGLKDSLQLGDKMNEVESLVAQYAEKINALDANLSSQMTHYQEELTQMQHDLETGLDNMAEALANATTDTTAVTELNTQFSNLQVDIENTMYLQKDLQETQEVFEYNLANLKQQIEILRDDKSDRDEVADALRDKAGLAELNGLVTSEQFGAVCGDFQKQVILAYDKFNNEESRWQKTIDDLIRDLNEKADIAQVKSLEEEISKNVVALTVKLNAIVDIVGEPKASVVSRKLHRDEACLSCATPAHLESKAPKVPALPGLRPPAIGAEALRGQGDYDLCYPGKPIPHPIDPRAHICKRWCGGSHTAIPTGLPKAPTGITISTIVRDTTRTVGTDGKMYQTDVPLKKPCKPCYIPPPSEAEPELGQEAEDTEAQLPSTTMDECVCSPMCELMYRSNDRE